VQKNVLKSVKKYDINNRKSFVIHLYNSNTPNIFDFKMEEEKFGKINYINKNIDIVYLMDSTGSMGDEVKIASNLLIQHAQSLHKNNPEMNFQFGFVYYNDPIDINTDYNDFLQLTKDINKVGRFCENWKIQSGGDAAEDWVGGYNLSINRINWRNGKRFIIHVCDAPAHGKKYSKNENDNHKEEKYDIELDNMMKECLKMKIEIIGIY